MLLSLDGLSVGDCLGERFFGETEAAVERIRSREIPGPVWRYTDDTEMALNVVETLLAHERIDQDDLARRFATRFTFDRGYGRSTYEILSGIREGHSWRWLSQSAFRGRGSFGNGSAMRAGPIGAYYSDDLGRVAREAALSAEVTHAHEEGIAGATAVAVAAALAWRCREASPEPREFLQQVCELVPPGYTR